MEATLVTASLALAGGPALADDASPLTADVYDALAAIGRTSSDLRLRIIYSLDGLE